MEKVLKIFQEIKETFGGESDLPMSTGNPIKCQPVADVVGRGFSYRHSWLVKLIWSKPWQKLRCGD